MTGESRRQIVPTSDSTFVLALFDVSITFRRNADGEVDALTLHRRTGEDRATRLADDEEIWTPPRLKSSLPTQVATSAGRSRPSTPSSWRETGSCFGSGG